MKLVDHKYNMHPLYLKYVALSLIANNAIAEQWRTLDEQGLAAFKVAHEKAKEHCWAALEAEQACYDAKLAFEPYWHVTPKQMKSYELALNLDRAGNP